ncbi:DnaJ domain protein [Ceratobasidium sp. AG-Ba]|nr:DnaJ domain protein [Ceratobasidium sp. AG-Ba]
MATRLYETLDLPRDATVDEIRRAYKKKALKTHPDRAPPERKLAAEEEFRKVNAAYEVLVDEDKRRLYDRHGIYPPPEPQVEDIYANPHARDFERQSRRNAPRPADPFVHMFNESPFPPAAPPGSGPFGMHHPHFSFTDPFKVFDHVFAATQIPFPPQHFLPFPMSIHPSPAMPFAGGPGFIVFPEDTPGHGKPVWTEETHTTRIVNGHEERIWTRIDREDQIVRPYETIYEAHKQPIDYPPVPPSQARSRKSSVGKKSRYPSPGRGYAYVSAAPQPPPPPQPHHHTRTTSHHVPKPRRRHHRRMTSFSNSQEDLGSSISDVETARPYSYEFAHQEPPYYEHYQPASSRDSHPKKRYDDARLPTPPRDPEMARRRAGRDASYAMPYAEREREPAFVPPNPEHEAKEKRWWQKFSRN